MPSPFLRRAAVLLVVALAARAITLGNPIVHVDEEFYFLVARAMIDGATPFVDIWDRKPVGLFLLYLPAAAFGYPAGIWAYQATALAAVVATGMALARMADRAGWNAGATPAAVAYVLWLDLADGQGGQAPVFYNLPMVLAALLVAPAADDGDARARWRRGCAAMALVGVALQIKYSALFEGAFFGLWWMWRDWRLGGDAGRTILRAAPLALVAFVPTIAAWGWYAAHGHAAAFVFANFTSILNRQSDPTAEQLRNLAWLIAILLPLVVIAWRSRRTGDAARFVGLWLVVAMTGVAAFGSWFNHYALPVMVPAAACAAGWIGTHRRASIAMLCIVFVTGQYILVKKRWRRGTPAEFSALTAAIGRGPGSLYVYSGTPMPYASTGRPWLSRYVFPTHLNFTRERGAVGVDQLAEIRRILAARPAVIVVGRYHRGEQRDGRAIVTAEVAAHYRRSTTLPMGNGQTVVYFRTAP